jgi:hypothetical protein
MDPQYVTKIQYDTSDNSNTVSPEDTHSRGCRCKCEFSKLRGVRFDSQCCLLMCQTIVPSAIGPKGTRKTEAGNGSTLQEITGSILYYACTVDPTILTTTNLIAPEQSVATEFERDRVVCLLASSNTP